MAEGNAAWARAQALLGNHLHGPTVQELPNTELFRQTTNEPGWMLGSARGSTVFLQPAAVLRNNGGPQGVLLHEFLHVLIEQEAGEKAPLWLREGLVETLANPVDGRLEVPDLAASEVDTELAHPADAGVSRHAHRVAGQMAALLCAHYGIPAVREFLRKGVPPDAIKSLGS